MDFAIKPKKNKNLKSRIKWGLSSTRAHLLLSPSLRILLYYAFALLSSPCTLLSFTLLLSFSPYYSFLRPTTFLFALLLSSLSCCSFLCAAWHSSLWCYSPLWLFFYFKYKVLHIIALLFTLLCYPLHVITIGVLLFIEESCTTPLHSFL